MKRFLVLMCAASVLAAGCSKKQAEPPKETQQSPQLPSGHPDINGASSAIAGIHWDVPATWSAGPQRQMRVATYNIPAASGDEEGAECGVFYFGTGQGGDVEMNIDRWVHQFENAGKPDRSKKEVDGMKVELVKVSGTYLAPSGPMMASSGKKEHYRLLGAIVSAPDGSVFFKLTGPSKTVGEAEKDFDALVASVKK